MLKMFVKFGFIFCSKQLLCGLPNGFATGLHCGRALPNNFRNFTSSAASRGMYRIPIESQEQTEDELYRKLIIEVKGHDPAVLKSYEQFCSMAARCLSINIAAITSPAKVIKRISLLKSVFVYKKHFVQYESRTLYKTIEIKHITGSTADTYLEYIQRNLPEGVAMKVTAHQLERLPEHIVAPDAVKDQIVKERNIESRHVKQLHAEGQQHEAIVEERLKDKATLKLEEDFKKLQVKGLHMKGVRRRTERAMNKRQGENNKHDLSGKVKKETEDQRAFNQIVSMMAEL